jgi:hypothetical protein
MVRGRVVEDLSLLTLYLPSGRATTKQYLMRVISAIKICTIVRSRTLVSWDIVGSRLPTLIRAGNRTILNGWSGHVSSIEK